MQRLHTLLRPHLLRRMKVRAAGAAAGGGRAGACARHAWLARLLCWASSGPPLHPATRPATSHPPCALPCHPQTDVLRQLPPKREAIVAVELSPMQKQARALASCTVPPLPALPQALAPLAWTRCCRSNTRTHLRRPPQVYRQLLTDSYESLTRGGVSRLKNVLMALRQAVSGSRPLAVGKGAAVATLAQPLRLQMPRALTRHLMFSPPPPCPARPQCQHVWLLYHPPEPRPTGEAWLQLLLANSGKLALLDRLLAVSGGRLVLPTRGA